MVRPMPSPAPAPNPNQDPTPSLDGQSLWPTRKLSREELLSHVGAVLTELVRNRDIKGDDAGEPIAQLQGSGETANASWCHFEVDISGIGMPVDSPLIIASYEGDSFVTWNLGPVPLGFIPKEKTAKEAAALLDMNCLLDAFRRFVAAESGRP